MFTRTIENTSPKRQRVNESQRVHLLALRACMRDKHGAVQLGFLLDRDERFPGAALFTIRGCANLSGSIATVYSQYKNTICSARTSFRAVSGTIASSIQPSSIQPSETVLDRALLRWMGNLNSRRPPSVAAATFAVSWQTPGSDG